MSESSLLQWDHVASGFGAVTMLLLGYMIKRQGNTEDKVDKHIIDTTKEMGEKVSFPKCKEFRDECTKGKHHTVECDVAAAKKRVEQIQDNLDFHSHTGLPADAAVIKRRNNHG
jgi:hypothetical protein